MAMRNYNDPKLQAMLESCSRFLFKVSFDLHRYEQSECIFSEFEEEILSHLKWLKEEESRIFSEVLPKE